MSPADQTLYREALEPWRKKAERERLTISHVRYQDGHATVMLEPRAVMRADPPEATAQLL